MQALFLTAPRRTGRAHFLSIRLSSDYTKDTQYCFGVLHFASLPVFECPNHLSHFALRAAFPPSLAGRYSPDYYWLSVTLGLAPRRQSRGTSVLYVSSVT
jgi:hypothetical protein